MFSDQNSMGNVCTWMTFSELCEFLRACPSMKYLGKSAYQLNFWEIKKLPDFNTQIVLKNVFRYAEHESGISIWILCLDVQILRCHWRGTNTKSTSIRLREKYCLLSADGNDYEDIKFSEVKVNCVCCHGFGFHGC